MTSIIATAPVPGGADLSTADTAQLPRLGDPDPFLPAALAAPQKRGTDGVAMFDAIAAIFRRDDLGLDARLDAIDALIAHSAESREERPADEPRVELSPELRAGADALCHLLSERRRARWAQEDNAVVQAFAHGIQYGQLHPDAELPPLVIPTAEEDAERVRRIWPVGEDFSCCDESPDWSCEHGRALDAELAQRRNQEGGAA